MWEEFIVNWSYLELGQILKNGYGVNIIKEPEEPSLCSGWWGNIHEQTHGLQSKCEALKCALCWTMCTQEVPLVNITIKARQGLGGWGVEREVEFK